MRIVFDECVPRRLRRLFPKVWEVRLLRFVTADATLRFQNRFKGRTFGVVSLELHSNTTAGLALHLPLILAAIREVRPIQVLVVTPEGVVPHS